MAELNFPTAPSIGSTYTANGKTWRWSGNAWLIEPDGLNDLSDVTAPSPSDGDVLTYSSGTGVWEGRFTNLLQVPETGLYRDPTGTWAYTPRFFGSNVANGNQTIFCPHVVPTETEFDALAFNVVAAAEVGSGSVARVALYESSASTGKPTNLIVDAGTASVESSGLKELTFTSISLPPGVYYAMFSLYSVGAIRPSFHAPTLSLQIGANPLLGNNDHYATHLSTPNVAVGYDPRDPAPNPAFDASRGNLVSASGGMIYVCLRFA